MCAWMNNTSFTVILLLILAKKNQKYKGILKKAIFYNNRRNEKFKFIHIRQKMVDFSRICSIVFRIKLE